MPAANGRLIHPIITTGLTNNGVTANSPTIAKKSTNRKIRPSLFPKISLNTPSSLMHAKIGRIGAIFGEKDRKFVSLLSASIHNYCDVFCSIHSMLLLTQHLVLSK